MPHSKKPRPEETEPKQPIIFWHIQSSVNDICSCGHKPLWMMGHYIRKCPECQTIYKYEERRNEKQPREEVSGQ